MVVLSSILRSRSNAHIIVLSAYRNPLCYELRIALRVSVTTKKPTTFVSYNDVEDTSKI